MKLIFPPLSEQIDLTLEDRVNILVIENQNCFAHFLCELHSAMMKNESELVLSSNHVPQDIWKHMEVLSGFVPFDSNRKTLLTKLYKKAEEAMMSEDFFESTQALKHECINYVSELAHAMPYSLDFSPEFDVSYLLKAVDFRFDTDYDSLAEQIIDYMETVNALEGKKCFVLINLRNYLDDECINSFYKTVLYKKLCVLMVSANDYNLSPYEQKTVIDKDLCVI